MSKHNNKDIKEKKENKEAECREKTVLLNEEEYNQLRQEAEKSKENLERVLRLQADFDNVRKRLEREKQEFVRFANEELIVELLNVVDDLERALELAQTKHEDFSAFLKGVEMILAHLYDLLKKHGLAPIEAKEKMFDPNYHEALLKLETDDFPEDTVVEELQKGYLLNGRLIRTTKVKVAKQKTEDKEQKTEDGEQKTDGGD
ncbi:MAG: nucleotide exchange factor GrpE [Candidatus Omnitrophota bacterium]